jgi:hypothetical protein
MGQHIALKVSKGVPVGQDFGAVGRAPNEVDGLELFFQKLRARAIERIGRRQTIVAADKEHAIDARHAGVPITERLQDRRQGGRVAEIIR